MTIFEVIKKLSRKKAPRLIKTPDILDGLKIDVDDKILNAFK
jgi:hypothetical protein